ncbi:MAG: hypothetical protein IJU76_03080, partial [Desulfovibrionaceae bacterium]|nr:hypothetical protein [Desulfovibrionaceae bacterium]
GEALSGEVLPDEALKDGGAQTDADQDQVASAATADLENELLGQDADLSADQSVSPDAVSDASPDEALSGEVLPDEALKDSGAQTDAAFLSQDQVASAATADLENELLGQDADLSADQTVSPDAVSDASLDEALSDAALSGEAISDEALKDSGVQTDADRISQDQVLGTAAADLENELLGQDTALSADQSGIADISDESLDEALKAVETEIKAMRTDLPKDLAAVFAMDPAMDSEENATPEAAEESVQGESIPQSQTDTSSQHDLAADEFPDNIQKSFAEDLLKQEADAEAAQCEKEEQGEIPAQPMDELNFQSEALETAELEGQEAQPDTLETSDDKVALDDIQNFEEAGEQDSSIVQRAVDLENLSAENTLSSDGEAIYADTELAEPEIVHANPNPLKSSHTVLPTPQSYAKPLEGSLNRDDISLRTRSMAEVLAEQGDIKGALDIYCELESSASSVEEAADLKQRVATLRAMLARQRVQEAKAMESVKIDKSRVINLIEALSERLEARAQN